MHFNVFQEGVPTSDQYDVHEFSGKAKALAMQIFLKYSTSFELKRCSSQSISL